MQNFFLNPIYMGIFVELIEIYKLCGLDLILCKYKKNIGL